MGIGRHFRLSSDEENKSKNKKGFSKISWNLCQCSGSSQIPSQDDFNNYHQFLSLYNLTRNNYRTELTIYNTENRRKKVKIFDDDIVNLDEMTSITQLPNGELFCYGSYNSGMALIINRNYGVRMLPSGIFCHHSSALYFDNKIYCFGGSDQVELVALSRKFDLEKNKWIDLPKLPKNDYYCHSVLFYGNILISGYFCINIWLYSIEINSFSQIPYDFTQFMRKVLINVGRLYLIGWCDHTAIYESEDAYYWKPISKTGDLLHCKQIYCLYNKEKIYISTEDRYYQFDLKTNLMHKF